MTTSALRSSRQQYHVCHITSVHERDDVRIFWKECQSLFEAGFSVTLIVADGAGSELLHGVRIADTGRPRRGRLFRLLHAWSSVYRRAVQEDAAAYHFHDPELIIAGLLLKLRRKIVIYDIHEDTSKQILLKRWIPGFLRKPAAAIFEQIEQWACRRFDALVVPQESMQERFGKLNERCDLIPNFCRVARSGNGIDDAQEGMLFHAGTLTADRGFHNMLAAMSCMNDPCELHLAGALEEESYRDLMRSHPRASSIHYHGRLPFARVQELYRKTHIGLILYNNLGQYHLSWAVKLFEYMAHGIPVIMPDFGSWPEFNRAHRCGICVDPRDPQQVADAVRSLIDNPDYHKELSTNGRRSVLDHYNWEFAADRLVDLYRDLLLIGGRGSDVIA